MNHALGQLPGETVLGSRGSQGGLRHYAEWWMWARQTLHGPYPRLRAAARAGMNAQSGGAVFSSAIATALQVFKDGAEERAPVDGMDQRYAELYVRASLALRLDPEAAHELAINAVTSWKPGTDISTVVGARMNVHAVVAAVMAGVGLVCLAMVAIVPSFGYGEQSWVPVEISYLWPPIAAALAFALGVLSVWAGWFAMDRIRYTSERGRSLATASLGIGCLLALAGPLAGMLFLLFLYRGLAAVI